MSTLNASARRDVGDYARQLELQVFRHWKTEDNVEHADQWMNDTARGTPTSVFKRSTPKTQRRHQIDNTGRAEADVSSHATEKDVGENHWDTSSTCRTATGDDQQELTTCSTRFQDDQRHHHHHHHHHHQTESDDIELETLLEGKDADDMIVSDQAATVESETCNQERSDATTPEQQKADYNHQTGTQHQETVKETKQKQAQEQAGHCSPRTETRDEIQQHEEQRVTLDVGDQDSEMDDHVQESSEETMQEQQPRASDSHQGQSESSEQQSSVEAADEQERDETIQQQHSMETDTDGQ